MVKKRWTSEQAYLLYLTLAHVNHVDKIVALCVYKCAFFGRIHTEHSTPIKTLKEEWFKSKQLPRWFIISLYVTFWQRGNRLPRKGTLSCCWCFLCDEMRSGTNRPSVHIVVVLLNSRHEVKMRKRRKGDAAVLNNIFWKSRRNKQKKEVWRTNE